MLCWSGNSDGEWTQYTPDALTIALTVERSRAKDLEEGLFDHMKQISAVKVAVGG